jgi:alpha-L-rhamnosidase
MNWSAKWIRPVVEPENATVRFTKVFPNLENIECCTLTVTALGIYEAKINGERVSDYVLAPG